MFFNGTDYAPWKRRMLYKDFLDIYYIYVKVFATKCIKRFNYFIP